MIRSLAAVSLLLAPSLAVRAEVGALVPVGDDEAPRYDARSGRAGRSQGVGQLVAVRRQQLDAGLFERARRGFSDAIGRAPARVEADSGAGDEALAWYEQALHVDPRVGDADCNPGCVCALQGRRDLAFGYLRLAALHHYAQIEQMKADPDLASLRGDDSP